MDNYLKLRMIHLLLLLLVPLLGYIQCLGGNGGFGLTNPQSINMPGGVSVNSSISIPGTSTPNPSTVSLRHNIDYSQHGANWGGTCATG
jgi:hypothetical protein